MEYQAKGMCWAADQTNRLVLYKNEFCPSVVLAFNVFE